MNPMNSLRLVKRRVEYCSVNLYFIIAKQHQISSGILPFSKIGNKHYGTLLY